MTTLDVFVTAFCCGLGVSLPPSLVLAAGVFHMRKMRQWNTSANTTVPQQDTDQIGGMA